ncbi:MAG: hypothetical protein ACRCXZ_07035 [Patescibacteria group bacterium]
MNTSCTLVDFDNGIGYYPNSVTTSRVYTRLQPTKAAQLEHGIAPYSVIRHNDELYEGTEFYTHSGNAPRPLENQIVIRGPFEVVKRTLKTKAPTKESEIQVIDLSILEDLKKLVTVELP